MGDYISQPTDNLMKDFMEANGSINLIKCNNCFKGKCSYIDFLNIQTQLKLV